MNRSKRGVRCRVGHGARCRGVRVPEPAGSNPAGARCKTGHFKKIVQQDRVSAGLPGLMWFKSTAAQQSFGGGIDTVASRSTLLL